MRYRSLVVTAVAGMLLLGACSKEPPPPPAPTGPTEEELAQRRADSIARLRAAEEAARRAEEERRAEARRRAIAEATETLEAMIHFDYDMSEIRPDAERILRQKVEILRNSPEVRLQIEGHADERGSNEYNLALGNRRAQAVVDFFTNFGLDGNRFSIISYGEEQPLVGASNEDAWAQNRRAEFNITAGRDSINPAMTP